MCSFRIEILQSEQLGYIIKGLILIYMCSHLFFMSVCVWTCVYVHSFLYVLCICAHMCFCINVLIYGIYVYCMQGNSGCMCLFVFMCVYKSFFLLSWGCRLYEKVRVYLI